MPNYNFDEIIDRRGTNSVKVDGMSSHWSRPDLIPMWMADMDFRTPPFIIDAIKKRLEHEILGYSLQPEAYFAAIHNWLQKRYRWKIDEEMLQFIPGVVSGLAHAIQSLTRPGDKILMQPPVYHPFFIYAEKNGRVPVFNPLILEDGRYKMNIPRFRQLIKKCQLFILCNPHNPGGRAWSREELRQIADICYEHRVPVISDEIHADLVLPDYTHTPFATVSKAAADNCVTMMAASKAFNIPGLASAYAIIGNEDLRRQFVAQLENCEAGHGHLFAFEPVIAAYNQGSEWLAKLTEYIQGNIDYLDRFLQENTPDIKAIRPQASYLVFLDCRGLKLSQKELNNFFANEAGLALNDGAMFGNEGRGFMRINIGCPRAVLKEALEQLKMAYVARFTRK